MIYKTAAPAWAVEWYDSGWNDTYSDMEIIANEYDLYINDLKELRFWLGVIQAERAQQDWEAIYPN